MSGGTGGVPGSSRDTNHGCGGLWPCQGALTNEDFAAFNVRYRVEVNLSAVKWEILPEMMAVSEELYTSVRALKPTKVEQARGTQGRPQDKLRTRDPW